LEVGAPEAMGWITAHFFFCLGFLDIVTADR